MDSFDNLIHRFAENPENLRNNEVISFLNDVEIENPLDLQKLTFFIKSLIKFTLDGKTRISVDDIIQAIYSQPEFHKLFFEIDLNAIIQKAAEDETFRIIHLFETLNA